MLSGSEGMRAATPDACVARIVPSPPVRCHTSGVLDPEVCDVPLEWSATYQGTRVHRGLPEQTIQASHRVRG